MSIEPIPLVIRALSSDELDALTPEYRNEYFRLFAEQVTAPFEPWRTPARIKIGIGGRGAGAKSISISKLLLWFANYSTYMGDGVRVLCLRSVQKSIQESSWRTLKDWIEKLGYTDFEITQNHIENKRNGSLFTFNGLNDLSASRLKSYAEYQIAWVDEADGLSREAIMTLAATIRAPNSELWFSYNPTSGHEAINQLYARDPEPSWIITRCRPGILDNPFFPQVLQDEWDRLKRIDPEEALHVYEGYPRPQSERSIFSTLRIAAMRGRAASADGAVEIGCDVARFGRDCTVAFKRKGMQILARRSVNGFDTIAVAGMLWDLADHDPAISIKVDSGYNPGVIDALRNMGANVVEISFGGTASDPDVFTNVATEMYFQLAVDEIGVPEECWSEDLVEDLTERLYAYDLKGRKKLEPKDGQTASEDGSSHGNFKARHGGRSPDDGDAFVLTFYEAATDACF